MRNRPLFTPTERRILLLLSDGNAHSRQEIQKCLQDDLAPIAAIKGHICLLRKKLPPDEEILCVFSNGPISYQHVRLLVVPKG